MEGNGHPNACENVVIFSYEKVVTLSYQPHVWLLTATCNWKLIEQIKNIAVEFDPSRP